MQKDLLPWILGAALIAAGALAATVEFTRPAQTAGVKAASTASRAPTATPAPVPTAAAPTTAAPASLPAAVLPAPEAGARTAGLGSLNASSAPQLPPGEVWQCIVNGQKIFSDKRCGNGASVRQIGDINVMDVPAPAQPPYGMYRPGYTGAPYPAGPTYPDDQDDTGVDSDGYVGQQIIVARERARREHNDHQNNHPHPPPNHAAPGPHNPR